MNETEKFDVLLSSPLQTQGAEPPMESFPGQDPAMVLDQKPLYGPGYPGPPAMPMQSGYGGNPMQGQAQQGGFGPMLSQMGQGGNFPGMGGMGGMGHPRANMMRPRMMAANKPMRLQLQQRLQGQQVRTAFSPSDGSISTGLNVRLLPKCKERNGHLTWKLGVKPYSCIFYIHTQVSFILMFHVFSLHQFLNQTRQGMSMKMENMGNPGMRPGMQPSMGGQVKYKYLPSVLKCP